MKERPILFSAPMVRALLAGTKSQTRRIFTAKNGGVWPNHNDLPGMKQVVRSCPYGQPGDRLWVRETFVQGWDYDPVTDRIKQFDADGKQLPIQTWYRADGADIGWCDADGWQANTPWKPSIHMPRATSRITLEITRVRVERLQDIDFADAAAEGLHYTSERLDRWSADGINWRGTPQQAYRDLWEQINGPDSWAANPWVWVVSFKRLP
jgi:hypothetical protein